MLPTSAGVEPATSWSPVRCAANWATEAGTTLRGEALLLCITMYVFMGLLEKHQSCFIEKKKQNKKKTFIRHYNMWCTTWEKGPNAICQQRRSRWACTTVKSDLDILWSTYTTISTESVSRQWRPCSVCANAQADQSRHCLQIAYGSFLCIAHHVIRYHFSSSAQMSILTSQL